jgi:predicted alpha-1,6-mannanase (GH76 family)
MADGPYSNSARQCFQDLHKAWQGYDVFWKRGNAFDTLLDYIGHHDDAPITAEAMSKEGLDFFNGASKLGMWWDDFGWWGIAFMNAYKLLGAQGGEYLTAAVSCWEEMHKGTLVWEEVEKSPFRSQYTDRQPRFLGGVWNVGMDRTGVWPGPTDCNAFVGIQNTVTNGLFLVLSLRLAATENDTKYLQAAMKVYGWLQQWFKDGLENRELNAVGWPLIE